MFLENIPAQWFTDNPNLQNIANAIEGALTTAQTTMQQVHDSFFVATAVGSDLDAVAQLVGITRFSGENDDQFRARIQATMTQTQNIASNGNMAAYLSAALGGPVIVQDSPNPGNFVVTILNPTGYTTPTAVKQLIEVVRAGGTSYAAYLNLPTSRANVAIVGDCTVGRRRMGAYNAVRLI